MDRLTQGIPRMALVKLRPEEAEERIPSMGAGWGSSGKISEECQALRLGENPPERPAFRVADVNSAE
jgi:hypothetical protein